MHFVRLLAAASIVCFTAATFAQDWGKFSSDRDRFKVDIPGGELEMRETTYDSEYGAVFPSRVYSHEDGESRYSITVVDFTDAEEIHAERANKTSADDGSLYWAVDVLGSIAYAAWNIRKRGGEITYDAFHYIQRVGGHQLQITNADQSRTYAGIYLHETLLYILEATVPPGSPPPVFFQQSLTLLNEEGETFNYPYIHSPRLRIGG
jgi:hypothetical protein